MVVNVIALNRGGHFAEQLQQCDIPVAVLQKRFRLDPLTYFRLRSRLRETKPDIVQSFLFSANTYVRLPGIIPPGTQVIVSERCVDSWKSGWQLTLDRMLVRRMAIMTANSQSVADFYKREVGVPQDRIRVIPNGHATETASDETTADLRAELGLPADALLLGFVGRLAPQKCLEDLVWAFHLLHQAVDNVALVVVGDGPDRDSLGEFAASVGCRSQVYFTGHRADAASIIPQFDVFCLPSAFEGMSNSLMEAMAAGVPPVVSDIPGNRGLVEHERTGLVCPQGDSLALCQAVMRLMTNKDFASQIGSAAQQKIHDEHCVDQLVQRHIDLYQQVCS